MTRLLLCARLVEPLRGPALSLILLSRTSATLRGRARHRSSGVAHRRIWPQSARKARAVCALRVVNLKRTAATTRKMTTTRGGGEIGLRSCAEATVIEDLLEVITPVSGLVKRNLDLIRQLGATATAELEAVEKEEAKVEKDVVEELDKRAAAAKPAKKLEEVIGDKKDFEERAEKRRRCDGLFEEAIEVARQTEVAVARHIDHIDGELANLSQHLHATGEFENAGAARPGDEVAVRLDDYDKEAWVLGRVVRYRSDEDLYEVADADDDRKVFELGATRVIPLTDTGRGVPPAHVLCGAQSCLVDAHDEANRLQKGDEVFGIYPDTTSFYQCVVTIPARRSGSQGGTCHCQFQDDTDETGITPDRPVPLKYVLRRTDG